MIMHDYLSALDPLGQLRMVEDDLLVPHLLDGVISVALHGVVVLVDLDAQAAAGGEVVRLGQVAQAVVLHGLQDVLQAHPLPPRVSSPALASLRPDLVRARDYEGSSGENNIQSLQ